MISLTSKTTFDSTTYPDADPKVTFQIRRYSEGRRHRLSLAASSLARELNETTRELQPLLDQYRAEHKDKPLEEWPNPPIEIVELMARKQNLVDSIHHVWVKEGFVSAQNIDLDGEPITPESLIDAADRAFFEEVKAAILSEYGLSPKNETASGSSGTSSDQEATKIQPTSVQTAENTASTQVATAPSSSPTT